MKMFRFGPGENGRVGSFFVVTQESRLERGVSCGTEVEVLGLSRRHLILSREHIVEGEV